MAGVFCAAELIAGGITASSIQERNARTWAVHMHAQLNMMEKDHTFFDQVAW